MPDTRPRDLVRGERRQRGVTASSRDGLFAGVAILALCCAVSGAFAQVLPGPVAPGRIEQPFQPQPQLPTVAPSVIPSVPEGVAAPPGAEKVHFVLKAVALGGVTVYPADAFTSLYNDLIGKDVTLAQIFALASEITTKYRNDGYILSQAMVPAQQIADGKVKIWVVEGFVDHVIIEGANGKSKGLIDAYGRKIAASRPLRAADLERYLLLINDLPGITARSFLKPSPTMRGAADLSIVLDEKHEGGYAGFDNLGSRFVGPYEGQLGGSLYNMLGLYDETDIRVIGTARLRELQYLEADHYEQLDSEGTRLRLMIYRSHSKPGGALTPENVDELNYSGTVSVSHPFIRSRSQNLSAHVNFDVVNSDVEESATQLADDQLRVLRLGSSYDFVDTALPRPATNLVTSEISRGLPILGASHANTDYQAPRPQGTADFTKLTFETSRQQPLTDKIGVLLAGTGQYAANSLLSAEQFGFGGAQYGRGYDPSQLLGDDGIAGKVELQYGETLGLNCLQSYQFYVFYDAGRVYSRETLQPSPPQSRDRSGTSTGLGLRSSITEWASGFVEVARELTSSAANPNESGNGTRFYLGVMTRF
jgi:hemolysin activation/secretion protein